MCLIHVVLSIIIKYKSIIRIKIFLGQNLLLVTFWYNKYKSIIRIKIFLGKKLLLVPFWYNKYKSIIGIKIKCLFILYGSFL